MNARIADLFEAAGYDMLHHYGARSAADYQVAAAACARAEARNPLALPRRPTAPTSDQARTGGR